MKSKPTADLDRIEGSGAAQLVQLMRHFGYNSDVNIELGTVTSPPPNLKVKVDNLSVELDKDDLIVAQHLTKHKRKITLTNSGKTNLSGGSVSGAMSAAGEGPHTHNITSVNHSGANLTATESEIEYLDELKAGDRVIIAETAGGQIYVILDRAVKY
ncbi:hypothetical protein D3C81_1598320 [compost metagenome]